MIAASALAISLLLSANSVLSASFSFPSPSDGVSCARAVTQESCHSSYQVDPNSYGTCCYNGALKPGFSESGLVLATQFWDYSPSTGPKDSTTIHGLWPDYCDGTYPAYCTNDSGIPEKSGAQITQLLQQYDPQLLNYMNTYYKDYAGNDASFWEHEYNKHGTCFTTLRGKCQIPDRPAQNQTSRAVVGYFQQIVHQFQQLPTYDWLAQAGITPSTTKTYQLTDVENALAKHFGYKPFVGCDNKAKEQLSEFWYYYYVQGPLINGRYIPTASTTNSSCKATVKWSEY